MTRDSMPNPETGQRLGQSTPMPDRAKNIFHLRLISDPVPPVLLSNSALPGETDRHFVRGSRGVSQSSLAPAAGTHSPSSAGLRGGQRAGWESGEGREEIDRRLHPQIRRKSRKLLVRLRGARSFYARFVISPLMRQRPLDIDQRMPRGLCASGSPLPGEWAICQDDVQTALVEGRHRCGAAWTLPTAKETSAEREVESGASNRSIPAYAITRSARDLTRTANKAGSNGRRNFSS